MINSFKMLQKYSLYKIIMHILCISLLFCIYTCNRSYANIDTSGLAIVGNSHAAITCAATGIDLKIISNKESRNRLDMMEPYHSIGGGDLDESISTNEAIYSFLDDADRYTKAIIYLGTNDIKFGKDKFCLLYTDYLNRVFEKNPNIKIILMSIPKTKNEFLPHQSIDEFNIVIDNIAALYDNVSVYKIEDSDIEYWDNVHLTLEAYEKIFDKVVGVEETKVIYQHSDIGPGNMNLEGGAD